MASLHLELPDDLKARLDARAAEGGFTSVEQFIKAVLQASAEPELVDEDVEELLVRRLTDAHPGIEYTPRFKEQFRREVEERRRARRSR